MMNKHGNARSTAFGVVRTVLSALVAVAATSATARAFEARVVFEDPGIIQVVEGSECGQYESFSGAESSLPIPAYADRAAIILNGSTGRYRRGDHRLEQYAAGIQLNGRNEIFEVRDGALHWRASLYGNDDRLRRKKESHLKVCYRFTVVQWSSARIDARMIPPSDILHMPVLNKQTGSWELPAGTLAKGDEVAVLPMFHSFSDQRLWRDSEVFQVAYQLGQDTGPGVEGEARWQAQGFMKDKKKKFRFFSETSVLVGSSVGVVPSDFSIDEQEACRGLIRNCISASGHRGLHREYFEVEVPDHDYAIPMLTGFDLAYQDGTDHHVSRVGAWLDDIEFDLSSRRLAYRVNTVLADKNGKPGFTSSHGVTLLTFDVIRQVVTPKPTPKPRRMVSSTYAPAFDRPGGDFHDFWQTNPDPNVCAMACIAEPKCSAWTSVKPGVYGPGKPAHCWLKSSIPAPKINGNTTSGVVYSVEPKTDRPGGDYEDFTLGRSASFDTCRLACLKEQRCRAWTFVEAGVQGPNPRCWLKDRVPAAKPHQRTTSGVVG